MPATKAARIESPHGGSITTIAVTPDGTAAITIDDLGAMRLWPALDGSAEPRVIEFPKPARLALGPDPRGFVIALIDEAGGAVIQTIDRDGAMLQRATLPIEPAFAGIAMTDRGTLAWRTDQRIVRIAADGTTNAMLATDPGHRLTGVAVAATKGNETAVAVIEGDTDGKTWRRARWLAIGDKLAWGAWIEKAGDDVGGVIALAPSGKRIAWLGGTRPATTLTAFDTVRNVFLANESAPNATAIEVIDDESVVTSGLSGTMWIDLVTKSNRRHLPTRTFGELASGGGRALLPNGTEIAIVGKKTTEYLGYSLQTPQVVTAADGGRMLIGSGEHTALLDAQLRGTPTDLVTTGQILTSAVHVGGSEWLIATTRPPGTTVSIVDLAQRTRTDLRSTAFNQSLLVTYDPRGHLIGISQTDAPEILRHVPGRDGRQARADAVGALPKGSTQYDRVQLWPVAAQLSGGAQVVTAQVRDQLTLRWVPDPRVLDKGNAITLDGALAAVDATARVYVWENVKSVVELAMYRDAKRLGTFPVGDAIGGLWPEPRGDRLLISGPKLVMFAADGTRTWTRALKGVGMVVWLDDGTIGAVTGLGIVRLDAKTGETIVMRCGWGFGLSTKPTPVQTRSEPMCSQGR